mmetsp:Transcript_12643/g.19444  ORF Transcript_12643/g.19444 Transcript_12643/m.19444 type:complete len:451 (-) Transcript_12643:163-1515(-)
MAEEIIYTTCDDCGKLVPESNLSIHKARGCGGRARLSQSANESHKTDSTTEVISIRDEDETTRQPGLQDGTADVIDLSNEDSNNTVHKDAHARCDSDEWSCPRCTLFNANSRSRCEACHFSRDLNTVPGQTRPPDPTRSERLVHEPFFEEYAEPFGANRSVRTTGFSRNTNPLGGTGARPGSIRSERRDRDPFNRPDLFGEDGESFAENSTVRAMGNGAVVGSLLGGAASYIRGRSVTDGMLEGALGGAASGVLMDSMRRTPPRRSTGRNQSESNVSFSMSLPGYSPEDVHMRHVSAFRTSSGTSPIFTRTRSRNNGTTTTTFSSSSFRGAPHRFAGEDVLLRSIFSSGGSMGSPGGMAYEDLLQRFGDGTENMGASQADIQALPTSVLKDLDKELPEGNARQCCICLEDFKIGDRRKTLPCLHGFHEGCIDRALQSRHCCPICNMNIRS